VDGRFEVQLEKIRDSSTRQSWMEASGLWPMLYSEHRSEQHNILRHKKRERLCAVVDAYSAGSRELVTF